MLEHMIRFTHRNVGTNIDAYICYYLDVEVSQEKLRFIINTNVEGLYSSYLELADVGRESKKNISKRDMDSLG